MSFRVTVRSGPTIERSRHAELEAALDALEQECRVIANRDRRPARKVAKRTYEPVVQVQARAEVAGRGLRGGVDVRGDGSVEAWTGRWRRRVVEPQRRESAYDALRRALGACSTGP